MNLFSELMALQMLTFLVHCDFVYDISQSGQPCGWGNAVLDTPEHFYGMDYANQSEPHSRQACLDRLK